MEQYTGRIIRFIFKAEDGPFAIALFRTTPTEDKPEEDLKIKGNLGRHPVSREIVISGQWANEPKHGATLRVETACRFVPRDKRAILEYLQTYVNGVGAKTIQKVLDFFGEDTLDVIRNHADRLGELSGLSKNIQKKIVSGCTKEHAIAQIALRIDGYDVPVGAATKIYEKFGDESQQVMDADPYAIVGIKGIGFKSADNMAKHRDNYDPASPQLAVGRQKSFLNEQVKNGHSCAPVESVIDDSVQNCEGITPEIAQHALASLIQSSIFRHDSVESPSGKIEMVYFPPNYYAETKVTENVNRILYAPVEKPAPREAVLFLLAELEQLAQKSLTDEQKMGVERAFTNKISVLTGKPGTGKTTCTRAMVAVAERLGLKYGLCAPTGRAAKNMSNACGKKALTIHRLLEYKSKANQKPGDSPFAKDEDHQMGFDLLLIDEASMVDTQLLRSLLEAVPNGCRLVFIGDDNQLPSVGAGRCLHDIIRSGICPVTELHIIHRQAQESNIILNAHRILDGQKMTFPCTDVGFLPYSDCAFLEAPMIDNPNSEKKMEDPAWVQQTIRHLCSWYLPQFCGVDPIRDVQILTPRKSGTGGVFELNRLLQHSLNPNGKILDELPGIGQFREGDRVMCVKNNYDLNIFNGDIGFVVARDMSTGCLVFDFYGEHIQIPKEDLVNVSLAYAVTIHKSQGSEYQVVVLLILKQHGIMLQRNLLFTGVTRAKQRLVIVGSKPALSQATRNVKPVQRNTLLWHRLSRLKIGNGNVQQQ